MMTDDRHFMKMALALAQNGCGYTSPNPMVGAVVVKDGRVIGKGYHTAYGKPHAEVEAIVSATESTENATIYVTLEPCNHFGKTPPCTQKIISAGIKRVVIGAKDPNPDVTGGGIELLRQQGIDVITGVCETRANRLIEAFIKYVKEKKPFTIVKCAATLDGRIAASTGDSKWVTGPEARLMVHEIRHAVDAIMVGIDTVKSDDPELTTRLPDRKGVDPTRIVLDTHLAIDENAKILTLKSDAKTMVVIGPGCSRDKIDRLVLKGVVVMETPLKNGKIDLNQLMTDLAKMKITSLLIEGGGSVIGSALAAGIVDKIMFFYAPKILGGDDGIPICRGIGPKLMQDCIAVYDNDMRKVGNDMLVQGYIKHR